MKQQDIIIIGGGIMGLMTAYYASDFVKNITILEKNTISKENKEASSFSYTRSIRSDYPDPRYTQLAYEAQIMWNDLQKKSKNKFYINCGCLNIAKKMITPDISKTYAGVSFETRTKLHLQTTKFNKSELINRFPQFDADFGSLEKSGGYMLQQVVKDFLLKELNQRGVIIKENNTIISINETEDTVIVETQSDVFAGEKVVITAGRFINDVIKLIIGNNIQFSITPARPKENKYIYPPKRLLKKFIPENFPVFAYLDAGIYGHPIFDKKKGAIKIGYYQSPEIKEDRQNKIKSVNDFIKECMPILKNAPVEDVQDVDQCYYDMTEDSNFIIGKLPGFSNIAIGTGWCGTGYKFAPLIGKILSQLALQNTTIYNIQRFSPERFVNVKKYNIDNPKQYEIINI